MEVQANAAPTRAWYDRRVTRWLSVVALVVGAVLAGLGVAGFVSASGTNDDAAATESQVRVTRTETEELRLARDDALAAAETATSGAAELDAAVAAVTSSADELQQLYAAVVDASDVVVACDPTVGDEAFVQCIRDGLVGFEAAAAEFEAATSGLREAITTLEEDLG